MYLFILCLFFFLTGSVSISLFWCFLYFEIFIYFIIDFVDWVQLFVYVYEIQLTGFSLKRIPTPRDLTAYLFSHYFKWLALNVSSHMVYKENLNY